MNLRALIVMLVVLNLGVAAWWLLRTDAPNVVVEDTASGRARLQLVDERIGPRQPASMATQDPVAAPPVTASGSPAASPPEPRPTTTADNTVAEVCFSFGPFADTQALAAAQAMLRTGVLRRQAREVRENGGRGWRVFMPAFADRAAADAAAQNLKTAGFSDLLVVGNGTEANSIALGRFSTETRAQQHAASLRAAGFETRVEPLGETRTNHWVDVAAVAGFDAAAARRASGAAQSRAIDCANVD